jgi:dienelactone hydrolase
MHRLLAMAILVPSLLPALAVPSVRAELASLAMRPEQVVFLSKDGRTPLLGYVFKPARPLGAQAPAIVMMHGRAGAYSSLANGRYDADTLSKRHREWGERWAEQGYIAMLVDGFGPRGFAQGFPRRSYDSRPAGLNEVTVRPLDAYGALAYLRVRPGVAGDRIGLMGWSNGGSATLASMSVDAPGIRQPTAQTGFRAALVFYPGCGLHGHFDEGQLRALCARARVPRRRR